jgi:hypothetical protein
MFVERQHKEEKGRKFSSLGYSSKTKRERGSGSDQPKTAE